MSGRLAATVLRRMKDRATVLTRAANGRFETVEKDDLRCYLSTVSLQPAATGGEREELAARGRLYWEGAYAMPLNAKGQVEARVQVNGGAEVWQIVPRTVTPFPRGSAAPVYWACDLSG